MSASGVNAAVLLTASLKPEQPNKSRSAEPCTRDGVVPGKTAIFAVEADVAAALALVAGLSEAHRYAIIVGRPGVDLRPDGIISRPPLVNGALHMRRRPLPRVLHRRLKEVGVHFADQQTERTGL